MKKFFSAMLLSALAVFTLAAAPQGWYTDWNKATAAAKKENKPLYVLFTGSDWCAYCIQLHRETLDQPAFKEFAKGKMILVYFDQPRRAILKPGQMKMQQELARKLGAGHGVPSAVIVAPDGVKVIGKIGGYLPQDEYMAELRRIVK